LQVTDVMSMNAFHTRC